MEKMNIKEALAAGVTEEQLLNQLRNDIKAAKADILKDEVKTKAEKEKTRAEARSKFAKAVMEYMNTLGIFNEEQAARVSKEEIETILKTEEGKLFAFASAIDSMKLPNFFGSMSKSQKETKEAIKKALDKNLYGI